MTEHILDRIARELFSEQRDTPETNQEPLKHDMKHPPGLVGRVTDYINSQCLYPREHLSVIADAFAIWAVQFVGKEIQVLNYYEAQGQPIQAHLEQMRSV